MIDLSRLAIAAFRSLHSDRVAAVDEVVRITDRGRPKALLTGIRQDQAVERGISEGWLTPGEDREPAAVQRVRSGKRALELLREDRDGR